MEIILSYYLPDGTPLPTLPEADAQAAEARAETAEARAEAAEARAEAAEARAEAAEAGAQVVQVEALAESQARRLDELETEVVRLREALEQRSRS